MAKGNLILGTAARKLGDVVLYRREGAQQARARVRNIANPRTASQSSQRSIMAPAAKFYAPLATVLETSFEGLNRSKSYSAFLKQAINDGKSNGWYLPKGTGFFPLPYKISQGTIQPVVYTFESGNSAVNVPNPNNISMDNTIGGISKFFVAMGYEEGDQVTLIGVSQDDDGNMYPVADRFIIALDSTVTITEAIPHFEYESLGSGDNASIGFESTNPYGKFVAGAIIVSRYDNNKWRRSTQRLAVADDIMAEVTSASNAETSIQSYMNGATTVQSDVYLNGSKGTSANDVAVIALTDGTAFTPSEILVANGVASVKGHLAGRPASASVYARVKLGSDYLLSLTTKGALPEGTSTTYVIDGADAAVKAWLQSQGVAASVFQ